MTQYTRACKWCEAQMPAGSHGTRKYCSGACQKAASNERSLQKGPTCADCGVRMHRGKGVLPQGQARCLKCKNAGRGYYEVNGRKVSHGQSGYGAGCRCEVCTKAQRVSMAAYSAKRKKVDGFHPSTGYRRRARGVDPGVDLSCGGCGEPVGSYRGNEIPYHRDCRVPKWLAEGRPGPAQSKALRVIKKAAEGVKSNRVWVAGECPWCGDYFVGLGAFCSRSCRKYERESRNPFKFVISPTARREIYERDDWVCQLCFDPVDPTLHFLDSWAATLDHIIPQSSMLIPDHSSGNLQLAHRMCNSIKGDRRCLEVA